MYMESKYKFTIGIFLIHTKKWSLACTKMYGIKTKVTKLLSQYSLSLEARR
jgi:hypothetical protein